MTLEKQAQFKQVQYQFVAHLRDPVNNAMPEGIEQRRMDIYRNLIYKNIEGFIQGAFPILFSLLSEEKWHSLVNDFICHHTSHSPYFLEISQEFIQYLQEERETVESDPPFLLELAHYEWVELALDVSTLQHPEPSAPEPAFADSAARTTYFLDQTYQISPLAWGLSYQYPVHLIGPQFQPDTPPESPTYIIVYRDETDQVHFMESNAVTLRLLELFREGDDNAESCKKVSGREALLQIAAEIQHPEPETLLEFGADLLIQLKHSHIIYC